MGDDRGDDGGNGSNGGNGSDDGSDGGGDGGNDDDEDESVSEIDTEAEMVSAWDSDEDSHVGDDEDDEDVRNEADDMDIRLDLPDPQEAIPPATSPPNITMDDPNGDELEEVVDAYRNKVYIEHYPCPMVREPVRMEPVENCTRRGWVPLDIGKLSDKGVFELAWLFFKLGVSARFCNCYLRLKRLRGMLPWNNNQEMVKDVDKLPHGPDWSVQAVSINRSKGTEVVEFWGRNVMDGVKNLSRDCKERIRDEGCMADFTWWTQDKINDPKATVVSIITSSDEMKLTIFSSDKKAHPVYISLINQNKAVHRQISKQANMLVGYLPVLKLDCEPNKEKRRKLRWEVFHQ
ncbi:hypothetical protein FRC10_010039 [Ceratobasidium sp. 414]|nr:hypothetical protein FRC10_010039 [Ceratobasidium sp. 414]